MLSVHFPCWTIAAAMRCCCMAPGARAEKRCGSNWLGVELLFSGVRHPQTQGKVERFHGTLEQARRRRGLPIPELHQAWLDEFRQEYNQVRPHEALGMKTPASVWSPSGRRYDAHPPEWEYDRGSEVHRLGPYGQLKLAGRWWQVCEALAGEAVKLERVEERVLVYYCQTLVREIDLVPPNSKKCKGCGDNDL